MKVTMGLASWRLLGAVLAALVGFGAYMYGGLATSSAKQAGVGEYVIPALEAAQPKQQSEEPSQSTKNSSLSTEAAEHALSAEDILAISNGSGSTEPSTGSAVATETPASAPPLPVHNPAQQIPIEGNVPIQGNVPIEGNVPIQGNVPTENASSSTGDDGEDSSSKKKPSKEKSKKNNKGKK